MCSLTAKGNGGEYEYFFCLGTKEQPGKPRCTQPYVRQELVERKVEDLYREIRLPDDMQRKILNGLEQEIAQREKKRARIADRCSKQLRKLADERDKLLRAYYADALPLDMFKLEQERIDTETSKAESDLALASIKLEAARDLIQAAVKLASNCHRSYKRAKPEIRRKYNQAFFKGIYVTDKQITGVEHKEPFDVILSKGSSNESLVDGIGLEPILVEVLVRPPSRAEHEFAREVCSLVEAPRKGHRVILP